MRGHYIKPSVPEEYDITEKVGEHYKPNEENMVKYSFWKGVWKTVLAVVIFGIPIALDWLPKEWMDITLGGLIFLLVNFLKVKYKSL